LANVLVGLAVTGGALLELASRLFSHEKYKNRITQKKDLIVATDIIWGFGIVFLALWVMDFFRQAVYHWVALMLLVSHMYREWEVKKNITHAYCADRKMKSFNRIKLLALMVIESIAVFLIIN